MLKKDMREGKIPIYMGLAILWLTIPEEINQLKLLAMKTREENIDPKGNNKGKDDKKGTDKDIHQYLNKGEGNFNEQKKITNTTSEAEKAKVIDAKLKKEENKEREQYEKNKNNSDIADATEGHGYGSLDDYL